VVKDAKQRLEAKLLEGLASGPPVEATDAYWEALEAKVRNKLRNITVRAALPEDSADIRALHARAFGPGRFARTAYRLREGTAEASPFCRVCRIDGHLAAAVRFTPILIGGRGGALLLGPLAVDPAFANQGHGRGLVATALEAARSAGIALVVLVGDEPYYARLGFRPVPCGQILLPGPVDPERLLAAELVAGALAGYSGLVSADRAAPPT
jgi:predicted N-acetyltransferase YhbS